MFLVEALIPSRRSSSVGSSSDDATGVVGGNPSFIEDDATGVEDLEDSPSTLVDNEFSSSDNGSAAASFPEAAFPVVREGELGSGLVEPTSDGLSSQALRAFNTASLALRMAASLGDGVAYRGSSGSIWMLLHSEKGLMLMEFGNKSLSRSASCLSLVRAFSRLGGGFPFSNRAENHSSEPEVEDEGVLAGENTEAVLELHLRRIDL